MRRLIFPKAAALAALSFLAGAEFEALLHGDVVPSPYVIIGAIVIGAVVGMWSLRALVNPAFTHSCQSTRAFHHPECEKGVLLCGPLFVGLR